MVSGLLTLANLAYLVHMYLVSAQGIISFVTFQTLEWCQVEDITLIPMFRHLVVPQAVPRSERLVTEGTVEQPVVLGSLGQLSLLVHFLFFAWEKETK